MIARIFDYAVISRMVAAFLLFAGVMKFHEFLTLDYDQISTLFLMLAAGEILFAVWLIFGFYPKWSRLAVLFVFLVLANVAFSQALAEKASCGCFGRLPVMPWMVLGIDLAVVALLCFVPGVESPPSETRAFRRSLVVVAATVVLLSGVAAASRLVSWGNPSDPNSPQAHRLVTMVCDGITKNHDSYKSLQFSVKTVMQSPGAKEETTTRRDAKGQVTAVVRTSPRFEQSFNYLMRGSDLRSDLLGDPASQSSYAVFRGCALHHVRANNRAVAMDAEFANTGTGPLDPRCFGFDSPLLSVPNWLHRHKLVSVETYREQDDEGVDVRLVVTTARKTVTYDRTWVVRFSARHNFLPVRAEEQYEDGAPSKISRFAYQRLPESSAWFLRDLRVELWAKKRPSQPDGAVPRPAGIIEYSVDTPIVNMPVTDAAFDFELPKGVHVAIASKKVSNAKIAGASTFFDLFANPVNGAGIGLPVYWAYIVMLDALLFIVLFSLRRRIVI